MSNIYIPGIVGILGHQGTGKSFSAILVACRYANQIEFDLCFNFPINLEALWNYCRAMGYTWLMHRILHNKIQYRSSEDLTEFMKTNRTLYILDEAGVYLNSRKFKDIDPQFLHDIAQIRHDGRMLWWIAQYFDMSDKMLRSLSSAFIVCDSQLRFNKKLGNSELHWKRIYLYPAKEFKIYLTKVAEKYTGMKYVINARRLSMYQWEGFLDETDRIIFDIYQSFGSRVGDYSANNQRLFCSPKYQKVNNHEFSSLIETEVILKQCRNELF